MSLTKVTNRVIADDAIIAGSKLANNTITNLQIASNAAIAGTKISPNFGAQNILTTGNIGSSTLAVSGNTLITSSGTGGNTPFLAIENTSGATPGTFGPGLILNSNVPGKFPYIIQQQQSVGANLTISRLTFPFTQFLQIDQLGKLSSPNGSAFFGTVTNSGPDGAIMESGVNGNGNYIRLANGFQICWFGWNTIATNPITWTFPATFTTTTISPVVVGNVLVNDLPRYMTINDKPGANSVVIRRWSDTGGVSATFVQLIAIGRWYN
jgi:hypothetical protein